MRGRSLTLALLLVSVALSGCGDDGPGPGAGGGEGGGEGPGGEPTSGSLDRLVPLRFVDASRDPYTDTYSVVVGPDDACVPAGCAVTTATGAEPTFVQVLDVTASLPVGLHAFVEAWATYQADASDAVDVVGDNWNLQWSSPDVWVSGGAADDAQGNATLSGFVTNHGPAPATLSLVTVEPDGGAEDTEVTVHVKVTPLDDAVHRTHVVGVELAGGAVPVTVETSDGADVVVDVLAPDETRILARVVENGTRVTLPADAPAGLYKLIAFDTDATTRFLVPAANLTDPAGRMRVLDTTPEAGAPHPVPNNGPLEWTVDAARPPYYFRLTFDGLDGRSSQLEAHFVVTAPGGEVILEDDIQCGACLYSSSSWGHLASEALTAGTYTVTIEVAAAQGWSVYEGVGSYGR